MGKGNINIRGTNPTTRKIPQKDILKKPNKAGKSGSGKKVTFASGTEEASKGKALLSKHTGKTQQSSSRSSAEISKQRTAKHIQKSSASGKASEVKNLATQRLNDHKMALTELQKVLGLSKEAYEYLRDENESLTGTRNIEDAFHEFSKVDAETLAHPVSQAALEYLDEGTELLRDTTELLSEENPGKIDPNKAEALKQKAQSLNDKIEKDQNTLGDKIDGSKLPPKVKKFLNKVLGPILAYSGGTLLMVTLPATFISMFFMASTGPIIPLIVLSACLIGGIALTGAGLAMMPPNEAEQNQARV